MVEHRTFVAIAVVAMLLLTSTCNRAVHDEPPNIRTLARLSLAQLDGTMTVDGLRAPVEIIRDHWGVPHIYAQNVDDLFFAQGYVMAQDRLWQMEMWRRWREGRLSEIFGPAAFEYDRRTRLMMYRGPWNDTEWTSYHPEGKRIFTAYANGINAYIEQHADSLPLEFRLTGLKPEPWAAETVVLRWTALDFPSSRGNAVHEIQLALEVAHFGVEEANRRFAPDPWDELEVPEGLDVSIITREILDSMRFGDGDPFMPGALPRFEIVEPYERLVGEPPSVTFLRAHDLDQAGSNNWATSGALSATGAPILANDPHRRIEMPALRYFVHLNAPGWNVTGAGEPPFVGVDAGHNERMAWGFTFAGTDMHDVFVEEVHPDDPNLVRWQEGWEPLRIVREEVQIKGSAPRFLTLKFSRHGPIFFEDIQNRRAYAVRSIVHEPGTAPYLGSLRLAQADACDDFFDRAMSWKVPSHTLICADVDGNIALQVSGLTPDRDGWNGRLPVPGTGRYQWRGFRNDLPREFNPERGWVGSANNNVHPPDYAGRPVFYHSTRNGQFSRIMRLRQLLQPDQKYSMEDHRNIQLDKYSLRAHATIPLFQGWTATDIDAERARRLVSEWDAVLTRESTAGAIYVTWADLVDGDVLEPTTSPARRHQLTEDALRRAVERLTAEWGPDWAHWRYGRLHRTELPHMLVPDFDLPAVERGGGFGTLNATGANFRRILDLSDWDRSIGSNAPGQSGQPGSPFYDNLLPYWANEEYFPLVFSRERVEEHAAHRLVLAPARTSTVP